MKALLTAVILGSFASQALSRTHGPDSTAAASPVSHTTTSGFYHNVYAPANKKGMVKVVVQKPGSSSVTRMTVYGPTGEVIKKDKLWGETAQRTLDFSSKPNGTYKFEFVNGTETVVDEVSVQ